MERNILAGEVVGTEAAGCKWWLMTWFDPPCQRHWMALGTDGIIGADETERPGALEGNQSQYIRKGGRSRRSPTCSPTCSPLAAQ